MNKTSFLSDEELINIGFASIGKNVKISRNACFYSPEQMRFGDNVRIDDFSLFSGLIIIGSNVHVGSFCNFLGAKGIFLEDFSQISTRCTFLSASDDFSGAYLVGPQVPDQFRNILGGPIKLKRHSLVGAHSLVFPRTVFNEGAAVGSMSLVMGVLKKWTVYWGNPAKPLKPRLQEMLELERKFLEKWGNNGGHTF